MDKITIWKDSDMYFQIPDKDGDERGRDIQVVGNSCLFKVTTSDGTVFDFRESYTFETKGGEVIAAKYDWGKKTPFGDDFPYIVTQAPMIADKDKIRRWNEDNNDYEDLNFADVQAYSEADYELTWDENYKGTPIPLLKVNQYTYIDRPITNKENAYALITNHSKMIFNFYYGDSAFDKDYDFCVAVGNPESASNYYYKYKIGSNAESGRWYTVILDIKQAGSGRVSEKVLAVKDNYTGDLYTGSDAANYFKSDSSGANYFNGIIIDDDDHGHSLYVSSFIWVNKDISLNLALALGEEICPTQLGTN